MGGLWAQQEVDPLVERPSHLRVTDMLHIMCSSTSHSDRSDTQHDTLQNSVWALLCAEHGQGEDLDTKMGIHMSRTAWPLSVTFHTEGCGGNYFSTIPDVKYS